MIAVLFTDEEHRALSALLAHVCQIEAAKAPTDTTVQAHLRILQRVVEAAIGPSNPILEELKKVEH